MTQRDRILQRLQTGEWLSNVEIIKEMYILRASERVRELKKMGHTIESRRVQGKSYQEYRLIPANKVVLPPARKPEAISPIKLF